ncbi:MAG: hypothetical protein DRH04_03280 [Deltaproteobacteria bacterium]|nr:MAG: hypothetical protein DRH04_03280 [Deltaproteobacteria bacterium]
MGKTFTVALLILLLTAAVVPAKMQEKRSEEEIAKVAIGAYQDGFYEVAKEELEDFLIAYPDSGYVAQIKLMLFLTCLHLSECQEASQLWSDIGGKAALENSGFSPAQLLFQLGFCFFQELKFEPAQRYFRQILTAYPRGDLACQARFFLVKMAFHRESYEQAAADAAQLLKLKNPRLSPVQNKELLYFAGLSHYRLGRYDDALPLLRRYFADYADGMGKSAKIFYYKILIETSLQAGKLALADQFLDMWLRDYPRSAGVTAALYLVGEANYRHHRYARASSCLRQAVSRADLDQDLRRVAYGCLVNILLTEGQKPELVQYLEKLIPLENGLKEQKKHWKLLGTLYYGAKDYNRCVDAFSQLMQAFPETMGDEDVLLMYVGAGRAAGRCAAVIAALSPHFDLSRLKNPGPALLSAGYVYGLCLEHEQRYPDAFYWFQQLYKRGDRRENKVKTLAAMNRISLRMKKTEPFLWVAKTIVRDFSLDNPEDEKLLKKHPCLVLSAATYFYRRQEYEQAIPSLLWLRGLPRGKSPELHDQAVFFLAESYYHREKINDAIPLYAELVDKSVGRYRELAALRLVTLYERQGYKKKKAEMYRKLSEITGDPDLGKALGNKQRKP